MQIEVRPRRSALYLPASNEKAIAKAQTLLADVIILDLEDAVAPEEKEAARSCAVAAAIQGGFGMRELIVRCNALATPWGEADLSAFAGANVDGILVPKINGPEDIDLYDAALAGAPANVALWAMIETCAAVAALPVIAARAADTRLAGFVIGTNDLAKEMRARLTEDRVAFQAILTLTVAAARANGLIVLDGVCNEFTDIECVRRECEQGVIFGFDGKTLIHPKQIEPCNSAFSPEAAEIVRAQAIIAAFDLPENAGRGVLRVDGKMAELLHRDQSIQLIEAVAAIRKLEGTTG